MKILSHGRRSEIYDYSKDTILKLYDKDFPKEKIQNEYFKTKTIYKCKNVQIPEPLELVTLNDRVGIVFQKIDGVSMMDLFLIKLRVKATYSLGIRAVRFFIYKEGNYIFMHVSSISGGGYY